VTAALVLAAWVRVIARPWRRRDPVRWFDVGQRSHGRTRAGGRCEYTDGLRWWQRCPAPAQQADHFYPWARGGATELANLVAACTVHNQAKGGRPPALLTRCLIAWRRRAYFPDREPRSPGAWYHRGA
jgi:5-methylcytosine-specific restriction endonuclease McrA